MTSTDAARGPPEPITPTFSVSLAGNPVATDPVTAAAAAVPAVMRKLRRVEEVSMMSALEGAEGKSKMYRARRLPATSLSIRHKPVRYQALPV